MKSKKVKSIIFMLTCVLTLNYSVIWAESTGDIQEQIDKNKESMNQLESEKDKLNKEKEQEKSKLDEILNDIDSKSNDLNKVTEEVNNYQNKIDSIQSEIDNIHNNILITQNDISNKETLIKLKEEEQKSTQELLDKRLRSYYKVDMTSQYIYMVLKSKSITELFNTMGNVLRIMLIDRELINKAKESQYILNNEKKELNEKVEQMNREEEAIVVKQNELKDAQKEFLVKQEEQQKQINNLMALESEKSSYIDSLSDKEKELAGKIGDLISYNKDLQKELDDIFANINNNNNNSNNSGNSNSNNVNSGNSESSGNSSEESFLRPGVGVITDEYGPRINPVTGESGFHTGVDLGDAYGAPVKAAKSGTVDYSGWISGYGNTIIINHGNGVQTLYAHNSELLVDVGQTVSRGQTIAKVGSTGMSTGPHIHWEIRINGQHVSPMGYV